LIHETLHTMGLPDLYVVGAPTPEAQFEPVGPWDIMSDTRHGGLTGWHRRQLGWLDTTQVRCATPGKFDVTLGPLDSVAPGQPKVIVIRTSLSQAYVVEVRRRAGRDGRLCDPGGVLVYKVDARVGTGRAPVRVIDSVPAGGSYPCEHHPAAPFGYGLDEDGQQDISHFEDPAAGLSLDVLGRFGDFFHVRVEADRTYTAPRTTILSPRRTRFTTRRRRAKIKLAFRSPDIAETFSCRVDRRSWFTCKTPRHLRLRPGRHVIRVRAVDVTGSADATPAKRVVRVIRRR
jgi:hypothetical protein